MSLGGGSSTTTQQQAQASSQAPPSWAAAAGQQALQAAQSLAQAPFVIPPQPIAPLNAQQGQAFQSIQDLQSAYTPYPIAGGLMQSMSSVNPYQGASAGMMTAGAQNPLLGGAAGLIGQGGNILGQGAETVAGGIPYLGQGAQTIGQGVPVLGQGTQMIAGGMPYLGQGANYFQAGANNPAYGQSLGYMQQGAANPTLNNALNLYGSGSFNPFLGSAAGFQTPGGATQYFNAEAAGITPQMQDLFKQQMAQTTGNAVQQAGGTGADRIAIAQALLGNQQGLAAGQTYSQLMANAVNQAQQAGMNLGNLGMGQAGLQQQAAAGIGGLGQGQAQLAAQAGQNIGNLGLTQAQLQQAAGQGLLNTGLGMGTLGSETAQAGLGYGQLGSQLGNIGTQYGQLGSALGNIGGQYGQLGGTLGGLGNQSAALMQQAASGLGGLGLQGAQLGQQAGMNLANIGNLGQNMGLQAAQANLQAGSLQQQQTQNQLNAAYQNTLQAISWPFQTNQYLGSMAAGVTPSQGGSMLGLGTGQSTTSGFNVGSGNLGGGLGALKGGGQRGGRINGDDVESIHKLYGGRLPQQAGGSTYAEGGRTAMGKGGDAGTAGSVRGALPAQQPQDTLSGKAQGIGLPTEYLWGPTSQAQAQIRRDNPNDPRGYNVELGTAEWDPKTSQETFWDPTTSAGPLPPGAADQSSLADLATGMGHLRINRPGSDATLTGPGIQGWRSGLPPPAGFPMLVWDAGQHFQDIANAGPSFAQGVRGPDFSAGVPLVVSGPSAWEPAAAAAPAPAAAAAAAPAAASAVKKARGGALHRDAGGGTSDPWAGTPKTIPWAPTPSWDQMAKMSSLSGGSSPPPAISADGQTPWNTPQASADTMRVATTPALAAKYGIDTTNGKGAGPTPQPGQKPVSIPSSGIAKGGGQTQDQALASRGYTPEVINQLTGGMSNLLTGLQGMQSPTWSGWGGNVPSPSAWQHIEPNWAAADPTQAPTGGVGPPSGGTVPQPGAGVMPGRMASSGGRMPMQGGGTSPQAGFTPFPAPTEEGKTPQPPGSGLVTTPGRPWPLGASSTINLLGPLFAGGLQASNFDIANALNGGWGGAGGGGGGGAGVGVVPPGGGGAGGAPTGGGTGRPAIDYPYLASMADPIEGYGKPGQQPVLNWPMALMGPMASQYSSGKGGAFDQINPSGWGPAAQALQSTLGNYGSSPLQLPNIPGLNGNPSGGTSIPSAGALNIPTPSGGPQPAAAAIAPPSWNIPNIPSTVVSPPNIDFSNPNLTGAIRSATQSAVPGFLPRFQGGGGIGQQQVPHLSADLTTPFLPPAKIGPGEINNFDLLGSTNVAGLPGQQGPQPAGIGLPAPPKFSPPQAGKSGGEGGGGGGDKGKGKGKQQQQQAQQDKQQDKEQDQQDNQGTEGLPPKDTTTTDPAGILSSGNIGPNAGLSSGQGMSLPAMSFGPAGGGSGDMMAALSAPGGGGDFGGGGGGTKGDGGSAFATRGGRFDDGGDVGDDGGSGGGDPFGDVTAADLRGLAGLRGGMELPPTNAFTMPGRGGPGLTSAPGVAPTPPSMLQGAQQPSFGAAPPPLPSTGAFGLPGGLGQKALFDYTTSQFGGQPLPYGQHSPTEGAPIGAEAQGALMGQGAGAPGPGGMPSPMPPPGLGGVPPPGMPGGIPPSPGLGGVPPPGGGGPPQGDMGKLLAALQQVKQTGGFNPPRTAEQAADRQSPSLYRAPDGKISTLPPGGEVLSGPEAGVQQANEEVRRAGGLPPQITPFQGNQGDKGFPAVPPVGPAGGQAGPSGGIGLMPPTGQDIGNIANAFRQTGGLNPPRTVEQVQPPSAPPPAMSFQGNQGDKGFPATPPPLPQPRPIAAGPSLQTVPASLHYDPRTGVFLPGGPQGGLIKITDPSTGRTIVVPQLGNFYDRSGHGRGINLTPGAAGQLGLGRTAGTFPTDSPLQFTRLPSAASGQQPIMLPRPRPPDAASSFTDRFGNWPGPPMGGGSYGGAPGGPAPITVPSAAGPAADRALDVARENAAGLKVVPGAPVAAPPVSRETSPMPASAAPSPAAAPALSRSEMNGLNFAKKWNGKTLGEFLDASPQGRPAMMPDAIASTKFNFNKKDWVKNLQDAIRSHLPSWVPSSIVDGIPAKLAEQARGMGITDLGHIKLPAPPPAPPPSSAQPRLPQPAPSPPPASATQPTRSALLSGQPMSSTPQPLVGGMTRPPQTVPPGSQVGANPTRDRWVSSAHVGNYRLGGSDTRPTVGYSSTMRAARAKAAAGLTDRDRLELVGMAIRENANDPIGPIESIFNRSAQNGIPIRTLLHNGFYRNTAPYFVSSGTAARSSPQTWQHYQSAVDAAVNGSNVLGGATDQGSLALNDPNSRNTSGRIFRSNEVYNDHTPAAARWRRQIQQKVQQEHGNTSDRQQITHSRLLDPRPFARGGADDDDTAAPTDVDTNIPADQNDATLANALAKPVSDVAPVTKVAAADVPPVNAPPPSFGPDTKGFKPIHENKPPSVTELKTTIPPEQAPAGEKTAQPSQPAPAPAPAPAGGAAATSRRQYTTSGQPKPPPGYDPSMLRLANFWYVLGGGAPGTAEAVAAQRLGLYQRLIEYGNLRSRFDYPNSSAEQNGANLATEADHVQKTHTELADAAGHGHDEAAVQGENKLSAPAGAPPVPGAPGPAAPAAVMPAAGIPPAPTGPAAAPPGPAGGSAPGPVPAPVATPVAAPAAAAPIAPAGGAQGVPPPAASMPAPQQKIAQGPPPPLGTSPQEQEFTGRAFAQHMGQFDRADWMRKNTVDWEGADRMTAGAVSGMNQLLNGVTSRNFNAAQTQRVMLETRKAGYMPLPNGMGWINWNETNPQTNQPGRIHSYTEMIPIMRDIARQVADQQRQQAGAPTSAPGAAGVPAMGPNLLSPQLMEQTPPPFAGAPATKPAVTSERPLSFGAETKYQPPTNYGPDPFVTPRSFSGQPTTVARPTYADAQNPDSPYSSTNWYGGQFGQPISRLDRNQEVVTAAGNEAVQANKVDGQLVALLRTIDKLKPGDYGPGVPGYETLVNSVNRAAALAGRALGLPENELPQPLTPNSSAAEFERHTFDVARMMVQGTTGRQYGQIINLTMKHLPNIADTPAAMRASVAASLAENARVRDRANEAGLWARSGLPLDNAFEQWFDRAYPPDRYASMAEIFAARDAKGTEISNRMQQKIQQMYQANPKDPALVQFREAFKLSPEAMNLLVVGGQ